MDKKLKITKSSLMTDRGKPRTEKPVESKTYELKELPTKSSYDNLKKSKVKKLVPDFPDYCYFIEKKLDLDSNLISSLNYNDKKIHVLLNQMYDEEKDYINTKGELLSQIELNRDKIADLKLRSNQDELNSKLKENSLYQNKKLFEFKDLFHENKKLLKSIRTQIKTKL